MDAEDPIPTRRFDPDAQRFADVPLLVRDPTGEVRVLRGSIDLNRFGFEISGMAAVDLAFGVLVNDDLGVVETVYAGQAVDDPRECWVHRLGSEARKTGSIESYRADVARLLTSLDRAIELGWRLVLDDRELLAFMPPAPARSGRA